MALVIYMKLVFKHKVGVKLIEWLVPGFLFFLFQIPIIFLRLLYFQHYIENVLTLAPLPSGVLSLISLSEALTHFRANFIGTPYYFKENDRLKFPTE